MPQKFFSVGLLQRAGRLLVSAFYLTLLLSGRVCAWDEAFSSFSGEFSPDSLMTGEGKKDNMPSNVRNSGDAVLLFPLGDLYPQYTADPHRVGFGIELLNYTKTRIAESGNSRIGLRAGGRFGIIRGQPHDQADRGWQLSIEGGYNALFDADYSLDNIGWDGKYGFVLTAAPARGIAFKFAALHDSSHVGDEYMKRTGRTRIGYTRHELVAGISWAVDEHWRTYAEAARGYQMTNKKLQKPGRAQLGLEFGSPVTCWNGCTGWYGALDMSAMEERAWHVDTSLQTGIVSRSGGRTWRFGIQWYNGRPPIGEFFQNTECSLSLGLWVDV